MKRQKEENAWLEARRQEAIRKFEFNAEGVARMERAALNMANAYCTHADMDAMWAYIQSVWPETMIVDCGEGKPYALLMAEKMIEYAETIKNHSSWWVCDTMPFTFWRYEPSFEDEGVAEHSRSAIQFDTPHELSKVLILELGFCCNVTKKRENFTKYDIPSLHTFSDSLVWWKVTGRVPFDWAFWQGESALPRIAERCSQARRNYRFGTVPGFEKCVLIDC